MIKYLKRFEPFIFLTVVLFNLSPLFITHYFTTMDGGSHINNAHILKTIFTSSQNLYSNSFIINPELVPNWSGHFVLAFLLLFFKSVVAEKILVACLLILTPLFIRKIIKLTAPQNIIISYFIFPFTQYLLLYLGFFNFTLGILFLLIFVFYYLKYNTAFKLQHYLLLTLLFFCIYFSHLFVFLITVLFVGMHLGCALIFSENKFVRNKLLLKSLFVFICSLPFLYLSINYFRHRPAKGDIEIKYLNTKEIIKMFFNGDAFTVYSDKETPYSKLFVSVILFLFLFALAKKAYYFLRSENKIQFVAIFLQSIEFVFLLLSAFLLLLAFRLPNDDGYGGLITIRFIYFVFLFLFLFVACQQKSSTIVNILALMVTAYSFCYSVHFKKDGIRWLDTERSKFDAAFAMIPDNSIVANYVLSNNDNWLGGHIPEYANADKKIIVLNNYETDKGYFPVILNKNQYPKYMIGGYFISKDICKNCEGMDNRPATNVDYALIYGVKENNEEYKKVSESFGNGYVIAYSSPTINLYKLK